MYLALSFRFLVLEHVSGGELFDHLVKRGRLPLGEVTCLNYFCLSTSFNFYWKCNSAYFGLLYLSVSTCDLIGPFCRLYFIVRPTKCKSLFWLPKCVLKKNLEQTSEKLHKWGNRAKLPNFQVGFLEFFWRRQTANKERWPSMMKVLKRSSNTVKRQNISGDSLKGFSNSRLMEMLWTYLLHCVRIWCTSIINGHSAWIEIFPASILTQRYNKHLANLVFLGLYCKLQNLAFFTLCMAWAFHAWAINLSRKNLVCNIQ